MDAEHPDAESANPADPEDVGVPGDPDPGELAGVLAAQEAELVLGRFDHDDAWALGVRLTTAARDRGLPVAISIRRGPQRVFHAALPGSCADNDSWLERKARVVERFGMSSFRMGTQCRDRGQDFFATYSVPQDRYAAHGGAFPITVQGVGVVGSVAVSGLPQEQDHAFVVEQLRAFITAGAAGAAGAAGTAGTGR